MSLYTKGQMRLGGIIALFGLGGLLVCAGAGLAKASSQSQHLSQLRQFQWSRYVNGQKVWSSQAQVSEGYTTVDEKPYLLFINAGDLSGHEAPDSPRGVRVRYYCAYFPGYGGISAREIEPGETWVFSADGKTVIDPIGRVGERKYRFNWECTPQGKTIRKGDAEVGPGWVLIGLNDQVLIVFKSHEALPEQRPEIPQDVTWAHLYLPGVGEFYARVDDPNELWTFKSTDYGSTISGKASTDQP